MYRAYRFDDPPGQIDRRSDDPSGQIARRADDPSGQIGRRSDGRACGLVRIDLGDGQADYVVTVPRKRDGPGSVSSVTLDDQQVTVRCVGVIAGISFWELTDWEPTDHLATKVLTPNSHYLEREYPPVFWLSADRLQDGEGVGRAYRPRMYVHGKVQPPPGSPLLTAMGEVWGLFSPKHASKQIPLPPIIRRVSGEALKAFLAEAQTTYDRVIAIIDSGRFNRLAGEWQHPERTAEKFKDAILALRDELLALPDLRSAMISDFVHSAFLPGFGMVELTVPRQRPGHWELLLEKVIMGKGRPEPHVDMTYPGSLVSDPQVGWLGFYPRSTSEAIEFTTSVQWPSGALGEGTCTFGRFPALLFARKCNKHSGKLIAYQYQTIYDLEVIEAKVRVMAEVMLRA